MATVTGYTAARMKQIEDAAIIDGEVVGNNLLLEPHGFAVDPVTYPKIDAGNVRGPQGIQGVPGEVTEAELAAGLAATRIPAGVIEMWGGDVAPTGYLLCNGQAVDRVAYAALFAAISTKWGVGNGTSTFNLPAFDNRFPVGKGAATWSDALNDKGGATDAVLVDHDHTAPGHTHPTPNHQHTVDAHDHSIDHTHPNITTAYEHSTHTHYGTVDTNGGHAHAATQSGEPLVYYGGGGNLGLAAGGAGQPLNIYPAWPPTSSGGDHVHSFTTAPGEFLHQHTVGTPAHNGVSGTKPAALTALNQGGGTATTGGAAPTTRSGVAAGLANLPPFITVNFIIKT